MKTEYRVTWKRKDKFRQYRFFQRILEARRFYEFLKSEEPWTMLGLKGSDPYCCRGTLGCNCGGLTVKEQWELKKFPEIVSVILSHRIVGEWQEGFPVEKIN